MKTLSTFLIATLLLSGCSRGNTEVVPSPSTGDVRPNDGSQAGITLEEEAPSFITE